MTKEKRFCNIVARSLPPTLSSPHWTPSDTRPCFTPGSRIINRWVSEKVCVRVSCACVCVCFIHGLYLNNPKLSKLKSFIELCYSFNSSLWTARIWQNDDPVFRFEGFAGHGGCRTQLLKRNNSRFVTGF